MGHLHFVHETSFLVILWLISFFSQAGSCIWSWLCFKALRYSYFIQCNCSLLINDTESTVILNIKEREKSHKIRCFSVTPGWREHQVSVRMEGRFTGDRRKSSEIEQPFLILPLKSLPLIYPDFTSIGLAFLALNWPFWDDCHSFLVTIKMMAQQEGLTTHTVWEMVVLSGCLSVTHRITRLATQGTVIIKR